MCKAAITKYYFDRATDECKKFIYGGCGGNENRFDTLEQCNQQAENKGCIGKELLVFQ